jgi:hypothetical protein
MGVIMKQHKILFVRYGENICTDLSPVRVFNEETDKDLLSIIEGYCLSFDDNRLVPGNKYEVRTINLPEWLDVDHYCDQHITWDRILCYPEITDKLKEKSYRLFRMDIDQIKALYQLFKVKSFRSSFRLSLYNQCIEWFNTEEPDHLSPLSPKQWSSLMQYNPRY